MRLLNLGCGSTFHRDWVNVDMVSASPEVKALDLRKPLPFADASFDVVYHSHVLEHFSREEGEAFMRESLRVLKPGGIIRVVVPDLEQIARTYLAKLEQAYAGDSSAEDDYDWMTIELLDQAVRQKSGGWMREYLKEDDLRNVDFIRARIGHELDITLEAKQQSASKRSIVERMRGKSPTQIARFVTGLVKRKTMEGVVGALGGRTGLEVWREGSLRNSGEIHKWMYDRFSLSRLLKKSGATDVAVYSCTTSRIPKFTQYDLDTFPDGRARKPDSLYVEGCRAS
jgi:predicted SAM-dependent methyltransferase